MAPSRLVAVSRRRQDVVRRDFTLTSLVNVAMLSQHRKTGFSQKVNARHPLEFSRERLVEKSRRVLTARNLVVAPHRSDVDGF